MQLNAFLFCSLSFAISAIAAVDQALLDLVPSDAKILYGVDIAKSMNSPFGRQIVSRATARNPVLDRLGAATGFDLKRDLREVLFVSLGPNTTASKTTKLLHFDLTFARGTFRPDRFYSMANLSGAALVKEGEFQIIRPSASMAHTSLVFLDASTAVLGEYEAVRKFVAHRPPTGQMNPLKQKAMAISGHQDAWFASASTIGELGLSRRRGLPPVFLDSVRDASGGMRFSPEGAVMSAEVTTASASDAKVAADALKLAAGLIQNPNTALLKTAEISVDGAILRATLDLPERGVERLFAPKSAR